MLSVPEGYDKDLLLVETYYSYHSVMLMLNKCLEVCRDEENFEALERAYSAFVESRNSLEEFMGDCET